MSNVLLLVNFVSWPLCDEVQLPWCCHISLQTASIRFGHQIVIQNRFGVWKDCSIIQRQWRRSLAYRTDFIALRKWFFGHLKLDVSLKDIGSLRCSLRPVKSISEVWMNLVDPNTHLNGQPVKKSFNLRRRLESERESLLPGAFWNRSVALHQSDTIKSTRFWTFFEGEP